MYNINNFIKSLIISLNVKNLLSFARNIIRVKRQNCSFY